MALLPNRNKDTAEAKAEKKTAEDDVLMREVDEAVRQDQMQDFGRRYGRPLLAVLVIGLLAFGGYLWWDARQEAAMEADSETMVAALDQLESGNLDTASSTVDGLATEGSGGAKAAALMLQAGAAAQGGDADNAAALFERLAADGDAPQAYRDLARLRRVALQFDDMPSAQVVSELSGLAEPGHPLFGSAGELTAMAYLDQGKTNEAGALFAQIAKADDVPESLRGRARQMAGMLGVDAIEDIDEVVEQMTGGASAGGAVTSEQTTPERAPAQ